MSLKSSGLTADPGLDTEIVVPASVANLGGGFDTLGVAVQLYLRARITDIRPGEGARLIVSTSTPAVTGVNAVERAFDAIAQRTRRPAPTVVVEIRSEIPMAAGLGSSAAATVAGLRIFEQVTGSVPDADLLAVAASLEGHADNAAPALYGGLTSVVDTDGGPIALRWPWPDELRLVIATPAIGLSTSRARAALPDTMPRADAIFNLQHVLAFVHALQSRRFAAMREAVRDRWHQGARAALVPLLDEALALDDPSVLGAFLSGAGPSVALLAIKDFARIEQMLATMYARAGHPATVRTLGVHHSSEAMAAVAAGPSTHGRSA